MITTRANFRQEGAQALEGGIYISLVIYDDTFPGAWLSCVRTEFGPLKGVILNFMYRYWRRLSHSFFGEPTLRGKQIGNKSVLAEVESQAPSSSGFTSDPERGLAT